MNISTLTTFYTQYKMTIIYVTVVIVLLIIVVAVSKARAANAPKRSGKTKIIVNESNANITRDLPVPAPVPTHSPAGTSDRKRIFDAVRKLGSLSQEGVDSINAVLDKWQALGDGDDRKLAYILATMKHENRFGKPIREIWGPTSAQRGYEGRQDLGNVQKGDGKRFMGRGFVQLTGRKNYTKYSELTGKDLVGNPDLVLERDTAAYIIVHGMMTGTFTGKGLSNYINSKTGFYDARRTVNSTDKAQTIANYAQAIYTNLS